MASLMDQILSEQSAAEVQKYAGITDPSKIGAAVQQLSKDGANLVQLKTCAENNVAINSAADVKVGTTSILTIDPATGKIKLNADGDKFVKTVTTVSDVKVGSDEVLTTATDGTLKFNTAGDKFVKTATTVSAVKIAGLEILTTDPTTGALKFSTAGDGIVTAINSLPAVKMGTDQILTTDTDGKVILSPAGKKAASDAKAAGTAKDLEIAGVKSVAKVDGDKIVLDTNGTTLVKSIADDLKLDTKTMFTLGTDAKFVKTADATKAEKTLTTVTTPKINGKQVVQANAATGELELTPDGVKADKTVTTVTTPQIGGKQVVQANAATGELELTPDGVKADKTVTTVATPKINGKSVVEADAATGELKLSADGTNLNAGIGHFKPAVAGAYKYFQDSASTAKAGAVVPSYEQLQAKVLADYVNSATNLTTLSAIKTEATTATKGIFEYCGTKSTAGTAEHNDCKVLCKTTADLGVGDYYTQLTTITGWADCS